MCKQSSLRLDIVIPTIGREIKLINCLNSIRKAKKNYNVQVYIYFSRVNELLKFSSYTKEYWINCYRVHNYKVPEFWNNHLNKMKADAMVCCNDDVLFKEDTIDKIYELFPKCFPDYDGIVGISQENLPQGQGKNYAFMIIGSKFADRFPNRQVWCLDYYRFYADQELGMYAEKIGKFKYYSEIKITHLHPAFNKELLDETHRRVRVYWRQDHNTFIKRQTLKLLWGENFKLIGGVK